MARTYNNRYERKTIKQRASRNQAARMMNCGPGHDVHHKDGNPFNNNRSNLQCVPRSRNRSFPRNRFAGKR